MFFHILNILHLEILRDLNNIDILNLFSIAKKCFKINYYFSINFDKYSQFSSENHYKKFYSNKINKNPNIILTQEIGNRAKILSSYSYLTRNNCLAKNLVSIGTVDEFIDLSNYTMKCSFAKLPTQKTNYSEELS